MMWNYIDNCSSIYIMKEYYAKISNLLATGELVLPEKALHSEKLSGSW